MDRRDELIFECLLQNSRLSTSQIAKLTKIPQTTVSYKIKKLEEREIITKYDAILNLDILFPSSQIYLISSSANEENINEFFTNNSSISSVFTVSNYNNYFLWTHFNNKNEENFFQNELSNYSIHFNKYEIKSIIIYPFSIFDSKINIKNTYSSPREIELDKIDVKLLKLLSNGGGRASILQLSKKLNISYDIVLYRFKKLKDNGYFSLFTAQPSPSAFQIQIDYIHLQLSEEVDENVFNRLNLVKAVVALVKLENNNFLVVVYSKNLQDYKDNVGAISNIFIKYIKYFNVLNIKNWLFINRFPFDDIKLSKK